MPSETEVLLPSLAPDNLVPSEQVPAVTPGLKIGQMNPHEFHVVYGGARARGKSEEESIQEVLNQRAMLEPAKKTASLLPKDADLVEFNNLREEELTPEERLEFETRVAGGQTAEEALADLETNRLFNDAPITGGPTGGGPGTPGGPPAPPIGPDNNEPPVDPNQTPQPAGGGGNGNPDEPERRFRRRRDPRRDFRRGRGESGSRENAKLTQVLEKILERLGGGGRSQEGVQGETPEQRRTRLMNEIEADYPGGDEDDIKRLVDELLVDPSASRYADVLQLKDKEPWELAWIKTPYGTIAPIRVPKSSEGKTSYMREAMSDWEVSTGADLQANAKLERAQQLLEALQAPKYFEKLDKIIAQNPPDTTPEGKRAQQNKEIGQRLANEFVSRKAMKEKYAEFEVSDGVKTNAGIVRQIPSLVLDTLVSIPEIATAFNVLEEMYDVYLFSELEKAPEVRAQLREAIARRLTDPYENPAYEENPEQYNNALPDSYEWALRNAEILWNMWGNSSMHDKLRPAEAWETVTTADPEERLEMGKVTFASNDMSQGAGYNRRAFLMEIYIKAVERQLGAKQGLVKGVDINAGDYLSKDVKDKAREGFENKYKTEFLERYGRPHLHPGAEWAVVAEQYAMLRAKVDMERVFGVPIEIKGVRKKEPPPPEGSKESREETIVIVGANEEVVDIIPNIREERDASGNLIGYTVITDPRTGNAIREIQVRKKILRPRAHVDPDLMTPVDYDKPTPEELQLMRLTPDELNQEFERLRLSQDQRDKILRRLAPREGAKFYSITTDPATGRKSYTKYTDRRGIERYASYYDYDFARPGEATGDIEIRGVDGRVKDWNWIPRVVKGADNTRTEFYDYSRTRWSEISFAKLYPSLTPKKPRMPMHNWSFDSLEYSDDVRTKLIAPGDVNSFTRNPRVDTIWQIMGISKHKNNLKNGENMLLNFVEWAAGPITIDTGKPIFTVNGLRNILHEGAGGLAGRMGEKAPNKSEAYNPLRIREVEEEGKKRIVRGRQRLEDFRRAQRNPDTRTPNHPLVQSEGEAPVEAAKLGAEFLGRTILAMLGL